MENRPRDITASKSERKLTVLWEDGHQSEYSFSLLRHACPCAECRGGHANMGPEPDQGVFSMPEEDTSATRMVSLEAVGAYAITIEWEDGHHFGIYNWDYLRALCPCPECRTGAD